MITLPLDDGSLLLRGLTQPILRALQQVPQHADTSGLPQAESRLIQSPLHADEQDEHGEIAADWENYVTPSLRADLASDLERFTTDLARAHRLTAEEIAELFDFREEPENEADEEIANDSDDAPADQDVDETEADDDEWDEELDLPSIYAQIGFYDLCIPADHRHAWYSALNQARLVMHQRHRFPEENETFTDDEDDHDVESLTDPGADNDEEEPRGLSPAQLARRQAHQAYQLYAQLQMILLSAESEDHQEEDDDGNDDEPSAGAEES